MFTHTLPTDSSLGEQAPIPFQIQKQLFILQKKNKNREQFTKFWGILNYNPCLCFGLFLG